MKTLDISIIKERLFAIHGNILTIDESSYKAFYLPARFIDCDLGIFYNTPKNILHGQGHPEKAIAKMKETVKKNGGNNREKAKQTCLKKYGVDNPAKLKSTKDKMKETNEKRYGVSWVGQNKEVREKIEATTFEHFGVKVSSQSQEVKNKYKETCLEKYGVGCALNDPEVQEKAKQSLIEHFGVDNALKSPEIQEKIKQTNLERYGTEYTFQSEIIKEKTKQTNLLNLGVEWPQQNKDVARKTAKSRTNKETKYHWKTNEEIICVASYEVKVIDYLNENKIEYEWQNRFFDMDDGSKRKYLPDLYLNEANLWIEIKGYFWKDAEEKWNWFHNKYRNSELWNYTKLKEFGIL